jgi:hypothetical protein
MVPGWCYILSELLEKQKIKRLLSLMIVFGLFTLYPLSSSDILNRPVQPMPYTLFIEKRKQIPSQRSETSHKTSLKLLERWKEQTVNKNLNSNRFPKDEKKFMKLKKSDRFPNSPIQQEMLEEFTTIPNPEFENKMK